MRDYGKVHTTIWASPTFKALSEDGRMLALYLLTCPHQTIAGVMRLPDGYASEDLDWSPARVRKGFDELLRNGFATRCESTKWVKVHKFLEWNPPENPNQRKAVDKCLSLIAKECSWLNPSETVAEPFLNQEQEQEQEQELPPTPKGADAFTETFWPAYPRKEAKAPAAKAFAKLNPDTDLLAQMLAALAVQRQSEQWTRDDGKFIPHAATWLNQRRWEDVQADDGMDFWTQAGFDSRWEAENHGCNERNAASFANGRRAVA